MSNMSQEEKDKLNKMPERDYCEMELSFYKEQVQFWEDRLKNLKDD